MKNLDLSTLPAKKRKQIVSCLRAGIQLLYFLFLPSVFTAAFNGVKYIFTQLGQGEKIEMTAFVSALLLVCAFTIVFGRFFCGFACAFGSLGDAMHAIYGIICKKRKKKPRCIKPELAKAAVAAGADGLMIEVHNNPAKAKCDGAQSLTPDQFDELMQFVSKEVEFFGKKMN